MARDLWLSASRLNRYLFCPAQDYYSYHPDMPRRTDYPLLRGKEVHGHINHLHHPLGVSSEPRPFFYQTKAASRAQWFRRWKQALEDNADKLVRPDGEEAKREGKIGVDCVDRYWDSFYDWPRPLETEYPYKYPVVPGVVLVGRSDQEREVSIPWIKAHRPEIVEGDRLIAGYDPVVIVDFKSDYESYDAFEHLRRPADEISIGDQVRWQLPLHLDFQATIYTWFYHVVRGRRPVGFIWWHMRTGKSFFTCRIDKDYEELALAVHHVVAGISANSHPRHPGSHCRRCLVYDACWGERPFLVASTEYFPQGSTLERPAFEKVPNMVKRVDHQLPLKLGVRRKRAYQPPVVPAKRPGTIFLGTAPLAELGDVELDLDLG